MRSPLPDGFARRRLWVVWGVTGAVVLSAAGVTAGQLIRSPAQAIADSAAPPPSTLTAQVEYRTLRDSVIVRGTVKAAQSVDVAPAVGGGDIGSPVVTKLSVKAGQALRPGQLLLEVSGRPVFVLKGKLPVYRDLKPGGEGDDVAQLQASLAGLGYRTSGDRNGYFGSRTKSALSAFYESVGYDPLSARTDGDSAVNSAEEAVTAAERVAEDAQDALRNATQPSSSAPATPAPGSSPEADGGKTEPSSPKTGIAGTEDPRKQATRAQEDLRKARERLAEAEAESGPMLPAAEVVFVDRFPARVESVASRVGTKVTGTVLTVSAGELVVNSYLQQHEKGLVRPGQHVEILSELTGTTATGTVASVSDNVAREAPANGDSQDGDSQAQDANGYLMLVRPGKALPTQLAGQDVRLTVRAASTKGKALVVPVSAVSAGADGETYLTVLKQDRTRHRVPVITGTTGDGYVEVRPVSGARLSAGDRAVTGVRAGVSPLSEERE
ncbi:peptidoglycan-binding protein [Streptomyces sp. NPDC058107]|uniref:peptidoglycan-binding protein n=1 Tax=Streptomyces sp. NPDC058107 TaxID=3346343 RepID=UPI0036ECDB1B